MPRSCTVEHGVFSGSTLFAKHPAILDIQYYQVVQWAYSNFWTSIRSKCLNIYGKYGISNPSATKK